MQNNNIHISDIKLGVVCPMANEEKSAVNLVREVLDKCEGFKEVKFFAILDNVSRDGTRGLLDEHVKEDDRLEVVFAPENRCVVDAYVRGYKTAIAEDCDWILEMDAGFSHKPEEIPKFIEKMSQGYDCVFGSRFCEGGKFTNAPLSRKFISKGGTFLANLLLGTKLKDMTSGFELFKKEVLQEVLEKGIRSKGHFFQTEIKAYCRKYKIAEVPIHYSEPSENVSSSVIMDSFKNLFYLFVKRLKGQL